MAKSTSGRAKPFTVEYRVAWDQERGHFAIFRGTERTPSFSHQQGTAVGLAIREAQQETILGGKYIIVTSMRNGKRIVEWDRINLHRN
jgi:hypothetical protein